MSLLPYWVMTGLHFNKMRYGRLLFGNLCMVPPRMFSSGLLTRYFQWGPQRAGFLRVITAISWWGLRIARMYSSSSDHYSVSQLNRTLLLALIDCFLDLVAISKQLPPSTIAISTRRQSENSSHVYDWHKPHNTRLRSRPFNCESRRYFFPSEFIISHVPGATYLCLERSHILDTYW